jgi:hypothetical protein
LRPSAKLEIPFRGTAAAGGTLFMLLAKGRFESYQASQRCSQCRLLSLFE